MDSIYEQMNKIDDSKSLHEKWNVKNQRELKKLKEALDKTVTVEDVKKLVKKLKDELPYGFLTATDKAVRYMSEEMDGASYATMEDLVKALNNDPEMIEVVEDEPFVLTDCFTEEVFIHHAVEIDEFVEKVKRLNVKYFGVEVVDDVDKEFDEASNATQAMFDENCNVRIRRDAKKLVEEANDKLYRVDVFCYTHSRMNPKPHSIRLMPKEFNTFNDAQEFFNRVVTPDQTEYTFLDNTADSCVEYVRVVSPRETVEKEWYHPLWGSHNKSKTSNTVKRSDVEKYLKSHQEIALSVDEFEYIVNDLWSAIKREVQSGSIYNSIEDVNMEELIDASDNPTHDLCYKLMGLADEADIHESLKKDVDLKELVELVKEYICSNYSCADLQIDIRESMLFVEIWTEADEYDDYDDIYDDSPNFTARLDIEKLIELTDDIDEFETYVEDSISGYTNDSTAEDFYDRAAKELESYFNCSGAFLEPSTQLGRGRTFLFADDMKFEGSFDFQAGESYIKNNNFEGFLELCKDSFTVVTDE